MTATQSTGTDTGALQLLDAIQATPVSSPGLEGKKIGTQDLEGGQLVGSNCSTTCKFYGGRILSRGRGNK